MDPMIFLYPPWKITILAPENGWLEDEAFPFGMAYFEGQAVSFREGNNIIHPI